MVVGAVFAFILYVSLFGPAHPGNWGTILVWSVGWPLLVASSFLGRAGCAVCPLPSAARAVQRMFNTGWKVPAWLKRHDATIVMAGFFAIIWAEEVTRMRGSPHATAVLLLAILSGAVVTGVLMPRRTWCRHLCPMGGFLGAGAVTGLVELRPTSDICAAKCRDHSCYKGGQHVEGCPLFNHVMFVDSNQHCVLCLKCVDSCPNDSPQLNVRPPARDLVTMTDLSTTARWTAMLAGMLVALVLVQQWERQAAGALAGMLRERHLLTVSGVLALGALVPQALLQLLATRFRTSSHSAAAAALSQKVAAWMPVVIAGFLAHQLAFVPAFEGVRVAVGTYLPDGRAAGGTLGGAALTRAGGHPRRRAGDNARRVVESAPAGRRRTGALLVAAPCGRPRKRRSLLDADAAVAPALNRKPRSAGGAGRSPDPESRPALNARLRGRTPGRARRSPSRASGRGRGT